MCTQFERTALLLGCENIRSLGQKRVAVFGIGGVGGYVCEGLARSGIGSFLLVDKDKVDITNLNRQIIALHSTIGRPKVQVMEERILDINPEASVETRECFFLPENAGEFSFSEYDYVVDAVDTVTAKLEIITRAKAAGVPVISSMGAGGKLDPSALRIADLYETDTDPLARVMRRELKKRGIFDLKVVYSNERPAEPADIVGQESASRKPDGDNEPPSVSRGGGRIVGSTAFVPSAAGLLLAGEIVRELIHG